MSNRKIGKRIRKRAKNPSLNIEYSFIKILTGSDLSIRRLPIMAIKSINPGPVVWLTACIHGDEVGGIVIIQEIFKKILKKPLLQGSIYAFPLMNPAGFETTSRYITLSKEDLNRSFPGNKNGSLAERITDKIFSTIKETKPALVLDLHNDWKKSILYTLIDPENSVKNKEVYEKTKTFSKKSGFPIVLDTEEVKGTLTYTLLQNNIPAIALELGESYAVNERDVELGVKSIWNILSYLGIVEPLEEPFSYPIHKAVENKILRYSSHPISSTSGIIRFLVKPGDIVTKNQPVARIYNAFGKLLETLHALDDAIVLGYSDFSVALPGTPIICFGII